MATYKGVEISLKPTEAMATEAQRFLDWRADGEKGGTDVAVARARQLVNRQELSADTVRRMHSFFSRHEVDKQAEGFRPDEDGYPSKGRVAWAAWGGDAGQTWARAKDAALDKIDERSFEARPYPNEHAARIADPTQFDSFRREADAGGDGIDFIYGIRDNTSEIQSIRFDAERFSAGEAQDWLEEHDFEPIEFEPADRGRTMEDEKVETFEADEMERFDRSMLDFRAAKLDKVDGDDRRVRMSLSSEEPVERSFGNEVLEHSEKAIDLSRAASGTMPLLLDHDLTKQIGIVERAYLDGADRKLRAVVRFGKSALAEEVYTDVKDGIRSNVSIGYQIKNMVNRDNGTVVADSWMPYEASIVSVPADNNVGVNRKLETKPSVKIGDDKMTDINVDEIREQASDAAKRDFQKNAGEILKLAEKHNRRDLANDAIAEGLSVAQFRGVLLDAIGEGKPLEQPAHKVEMSAKEQRDYSFMSAVRGIVNGSGLRGLEAEINDEIAKNMGRAARGFYAPESFWAGKRDLTVGTDSAGGFLRPTDNLGDQFVDALRARLVFSELGARFMSGLTGDVAIPKLATGVSAGFVAENGATSEVNAVFSQVTMSPKSLGAFTDVSRLLMIQSDPSVEQIVRDDLLNAIAQKVEDVAIEGGGSNEPTGITGTTGIGSVAIGTNGGSLTWQAITDLVKEVEVDNAAINGNSLAYLTNPKVKSHMASTSKVASTDSVMLLEAPYDNVYGYNLAVTNNVPSDLTKGTGTALSALIYGDFSQLMIGLFSTPDILIDPYTAGSSGAVRIRVMQEIDVAVRHAQSFAACLDIDA